MSSHSLLGLPPVSSALKPITPYLQRAHELGNQDPVMAYWCAYYAAQLGISLKAKDTDSRDVLFALLGVLERLKREIGTNDAVDTEAVSYAYVENFALKVFSMADNEDRSGSATRSTAKKFLAAANFLEVLKIFPKTEITESTEEKMKYAKWKAADIAKAFREGRKPAPGPVSSYQNEGLDITPPASPRLRPHPLPIDNPPLTHSPEQETRWHIERSSSPTQVLFSPQPQTPPRHTGTHPVVGSYGVERSGRWGGEGEATPGSWSTAATPGTAYGPSGEWQEQPSPARSTSEDVRPEPGGSRGSTPNEGGTDTLKKHTMVSDRLESYSDDEFHHLRETSGRIIDAAALMNGYDSPRPIDHPTNSPIDLSILPPGFVPNPRQGWASVEAPSPTYEPTNPIVSNSKPYHSQNSSALEPIQGSYAQYAPLPPLPQPHTQAFGPSLVQVTPSITAKVQKHCRFAISALDYEDVEQARKELKSALAILGE